MVVGYAFGSKHPGRQDKDGMHCGALNTTGVAFVVEPLFAALSPEAEASGAGLAQKHDQVRCNRARYRAGVEPKFPRSKVKISAKHTGYAGTMRDATVLIAKPLPGR